jgi:hypothetical protein
MGDVDRKKHDVDVIERVLGGLGEDERGHGQSTRLLDVDVPWYGGTKHSTVELTVGLPSESRSPSTDDDDGRAT